MGRCCESWILILVDFRKWEVSTEFKYSRINVKSDENEGRLNVVSIDSVPDKRSRILEVVVVRRLLTWVLGIWSGEGMGKG
jgi:hypothetical protein